MTTFLPAAATFSGWVASPPTARTAAIMVMAINRTVWNDRRRHARWAPCWVTGNALASSPPERRAWGAVTGSARPDHPWAMLALIRARTASFARRQGRRAGVDQIASMAPDRARRGLRS